jgi:hypothetical protein
MSGVESIPSARRLIRSLRDMGYDFAQAVADVVDNAVTAKASSISIDIEFDGDDSWVRIADNGHGMRPETLREAMRFGSSRDYEEDDLGKFGLGLKTASLSQCQCLSVASRWNRERADIAGYSWDLDHIDRTNKWEIIPLDRERSTAVVRDPLKDHPGTVVLWRRLDRLLGYKHPYGETSRKRLGQMCREVEMHLAMVFHRFLSGEAGRRKLKIFVNGNAIAPWDPFCRGERDTQMLQQVIFELEHEGAKGAVLMEPFILPPQDAFSSKEAADAAAGPNKWNPQQGFYIYRAGRMIQSGGWSHIRAIDEHTKLARIAVSFSPALDEAFKVNVAKMRVQLPEAIRDGIRNAIIPVVKLARETYDRKSRVALLPPSRRGESAVPPSPVSNRDLSASTPAAADGALQSLARPRPDTKQTFEEWSSLLVAEAKGSEVEVVKGVIDRLRRR